MFWICPRLADTSILLAWRVWRLITGEAWRGAEVAGKATIVKLLPYTFRNFSQTVATNVVMSGSCDERREAMCELRVILSRVYRECRKWCVEWRASVESILNPRDRKQSCFLSVVYEWVLKPLEKQSRNGGISRRGSGISRKENSSSRKNVRNDRVVSEYYLYIRVRLIIHFFYSEQFDAAAIDDILYVCVLRVPDDTFLFRTELRWNQDRKIERQRFMNRFIKWDVKFKRYEWQFCAYKLKKRRSNKTVVSERFFYRLPYYSFRRAKYCVYTQIGPDVRLFHFHRRT